MEQTLGFIISFIAGYILGVLVPKKRKEAAADYEKYKRTTGLYEGVKRK